MNNELDKIWEEDKSFTITHASAKFEPNSPQIQDPRITSIPAYLIIGFHKTFPISEVTKPKGSLVICAKLMLKCICCRTHKQAMT
jgi:hypothetical protein